MSKKIQNIKIIANKELFDKFYQIGYALSLVGSIVQNDCEISEEQLDSFHEMMGSISYEVENLESKVGIYINDCNRTEEKEDV